MTKLSREEIIASIEKFKSRRDALLHSDPNEMLHHLKRFISFCESDPLVSGIVMPLLKDGSVRTDEWWEGLDSQSGQWIESWDFSEVANEELALRFLIMKDIAESRKSVWDLGFRGKKASDMTERFLSVIARPLAEDLSNRIGEVARIASPEIRALQAVPYDRLPSDTEAKIFLSHKSTDKPIVQRFYASLRELGYQPWLDEPEMPAGSNLERSIRQGFRESCAAVFFVTENFVDERYLATEVDYAILEKREKGSKFAIITLAFSEKYNIPDLLKPYVYKVVKNELEGFYELIRALPVELGPIRWKESVI